MSWFIVFLLITPIQAIPQDAGQAAPSPNFTREELDQMLAPIALYPDSLLSQILMASTYPIEVVDADRWVKQNPNLTGNSLDQALQDKYWDMSVKSLCHFPAVLSQMSLNLDETTRLGNAFLNQQQDVMDTIQDLRAKAQAQGNLNTTDKQRVTVDQGYIQIVPASPEVIYVPMYNPALVYGPWWYPAYPPYLWDYGVPVIGVGVSFGFGFFVGTWIGSWCGFNWGYHNVYVINNYNVHGGWHKQRWEHNPEHRRGVAYWNKATSQRYGQSATRPTGFSKQYRGYGASSTQNIPQRQYQQNKGGVKAPGGTKGGGYGASSTQNIPQRQYQQNQGGVKSPSGTKGGGYGASSTQNIPQRQYQQNQGGMRSPGSTSGAGHGSAFTGIGNGNSERMAGQRGQTSRGQSYGGPSHGGGGTHGGGQSSGGGGAHGSGGQHK